jgi:hypothetical protein
MKFLDRIILEETKLLVLEATEEDDKDSFVNKLNNVLASIANEDDIFEAILAPYTVANEIIKMATTGVKIILNDISFIAKGVLAIRPSSWKKADKAHRKRLNQLNREWDASMKATGADSAGADILTLLAMPHVVISTALISSPFKAAASVNRALIDSGIRLPLIGMLPGATPPEEAEMSDEDLADKKRGELSTKDAVKVALMTLFFAHHNYAGPILSEKTQSKSIEREKITNDSVMQHLYDMGIYDKAMSDLRKLLDAKKESMDEFLKIENPVEKVEVIASLLKITSPEVFIKSAQGIKSDQLNQELQKYIKELNMSAKELASDKNFQASFVKNQEKKNNNNESADEESKQQVPDEKMLKKEALQVVFTKAQPVFNEAITESLSIYVRWIIKSIESIYPTNKIAIKNKYVKAAYEEKDAVLTNIINNIDK